MLAHKFIPTGVLLVFLATATSVAAVDYSFESDDGDDPEVPGCHVKYDDSSCGGAILYYSLEKCGGPFGQTPTETRVRDSQGYDCGAATCCTNANSYPIECESFCQGKYGSHYSGECVEVQSGCFGNGYDLGYCRCMPGLPH